MGRAAKLKQQRHLQEQSIAHSTTSKSQYVLLEPKSNNYLASLESLGGMEKLDWCPHWQGAMKFASAGQAKAKAKKIVKYRGYPLQVMEIVTQAAEFEVKLVAMVSNE
ncbi:MAG: hypothetical protein F6K47_23150 [Symploca sp. SIO2E6]|nr:hypothetical protein [Symploca sp. SIO2E6]